MIESRLSHSRKFVTYDTRAHNIDSLRFHLGTFDWSRIIALSDVQLVYDQFLIIVKHFVDACIPVKTVRLGRRDPDFITPHIKALLLKRNRLRRRGLNSAADELATDINACIANNLKRRLSKLSTASVNEMWSALKRDNNGSVSDGRTRHLLANPETVNQYFAGISFDPTFNSDLLANLCNTVSPINSCDSSLSIYEVEALLQRVTRTAPGGDCVPYWVFRLCSVELAEIITHIYNTSLQTGCLPRQWLTAIITPIPKISIPKTLADFRPISVTPILSRIIERIIVRRWIIPAINQNSVADQFAFRPSGSTTCALVYLMHHVTNMLENNSYVRCLMIDFSKAFDRVNPLILASKLRQFPIPDYILKWLIAFLSHRTHTTCCMGTESNPLPINLSIIQGSALGPMFYIIFESDLKPVSCVNIILKYADDTNLLIPEASDVDLVTEFDNIRRWADLNKMIINLGKTKEIVFHRPNPKIDLLIPSIPEICRVKEVKLLGVVITSNLKFDSHVDAILKICSQRAFLIKRFRDQGLSCKLLDIVFTAIILSRIMYASQAWSGHVSAASIGRIDAFLCRMYRYGFSQTMYDFNNLSVTRDFTLYHQIIKPSHCLHCLLPCEKNLSQCMSLRPRGHDFILPTCKSELFKSTFINRCLYSFV